MIKNITKYIIVALSAIIFSSAYAGDPRLSIWGAYSFGKNVSDVGGEPTHVYNYMACFHRTMTDPHYGKSAATVGIDYRIAGGLYLGASFTTGGKFTELTKQNPVNSVDAEMEYKSTYLFFNCKFDWLKIKEVRLYSRGGLGVGFTSKGKLITEWEFEVISSRGPTEEFAWQFSPLGVEYKPFRFLGVFAEGGFGNQGNMLAGIRLYPI